MIKIITLLLLTSFISLSADWQISFKEDSKFPLDLNEFNLTTQNNNIKEHIDIDLNEKLYITIFINKIKTKKRTDEILKILNKFFNDENTIVKEIYPVEKLEKVNLSEFYEENKNKINKLEDYILKQKKINKLLLNRLNKLEYRIENERKIKHIILEIKSPFETEGLDFYELEKSIKRFNF